MMIIRGAFIDHSTLQRWVKGFAKLIDQRVRKRKRSVNGSWGSVASVFLSAQIEVATLNRTQPNIILPR